MTQEELDALMAGDLDDFEDSQEETAESKSDESADEQQEENSDLNDENISQEKESSGDTNRYKASADLSWPPPPPTEDHKMVRQLDDVTKDSEIKATQIFDKLEIINNFMVDTETNAKDIIILIKSNISLFETLVTKFPSIGQFQNALDENRQMQEKIEDLVSNAQMAEDEIMMIMDMMQYQDIHRQKIERVINVMRALSKYMSALFEGTKDDLKRVGSAVHIHGDVSTEEVVSNEDIEVLIAALGKK
ncbi:MAG: chemotaxis protein [Sulfurospirillaceae bacterium]|nr:chemotaxis protein [Sulfurospirillaceae bacterium]MDD3462899.1 chemotaxis protein [Sulfurospirillaceae bacterium]